MLPRIDSKRTVQTVIVVGILSLIFTIIDGFIHYYIPDLAIPNSIGYYHYSLIKFFITLVVGTLLYRFNLKFPIINRDIQVACVIGFSLAVWILFTNAYTYFQQFWFLLIHTILWYVLVKIWKLLSWGPM